MIHENKSHKEKKNCEYFCSNVREQFERITRTIRFTFENANLLYNAFTHSSYVNEHRRKNLTDNERSGIFR